MSAPVYIAAGSQLTLEDAGVAEFEFGGDEHVYSPNPAGRIRNVPGQLWERVAEMGEAGVVNSPNYTPRIANAFRTVTRARREYRTGMLNVSTIRLTPAGECMFYREMDARYGTSKASPLHHSQRCPIHHYRHTGFECGAL